jgi:hypothetical protein
MNLHVVYDATGRIIAAVRLPDGQTKTDQPGPRPVVKPGNRSADLEVPPEFAHLSFGEACRSLVVDESDAQPRLKARPT